MVFDLTRPGIESESTVSEVDAQYTRPLIGLKRKRTKAKEKRLLKCAKHQPIS